MIASKIFCVPFSPTIFILSLIKAMEKGSLQHLKSAVVVTGLLRYNHRPFQTIPQRCLRQRTTCKLADCFLEKLWMKQHLTGIQVKNPMFFMCVNLSRGIQMRMIMIWLGILRFPVTMRCNLKTHNWCVFA